MPPVDGGLGTALVGEKLTMGNLNLSVTKLLGEGGFSYVYLVKDTETMGLLGSSQHAAAAKQQANAREESANRSGSNSGTNSEIPPGPLVLKVTSIHSRSQRDIAEKEAKLLSRLSHPSIIKMYHGCYRQTSSQQSGKRGKDTTNGGKERPQHLILMEYCEGGHALDVCNRLASAGQRFDLSALIIAFGQICNAVSYLHAQRPPIVHRDLKPVNFLVKNGAYKLCDFGSAVFGHVDLRTPKARSEAEEVVQKTTTQMFRAPEMVDLYVAKKLTQATDVWALGCCLYSLAFLRNCFEEGSNLAILSRKYTIPEDNPYGDGLVELIDRMLTVDYKSRADMTEVILCLSAVYSGRPLPPRKKSSRTPKSDEKEQIKKTAAPVKKETSGETRIGKFRTDAQGFRDDNLYDPSKVTEGKKLASNSVAARRKRAAVSSAAAPPAASASNSNPMPSSSQADPLTFSSMQGSVDENTSDVAFSAFGDLNGFDSKGEDFFQAFDNNKDDQQNFRTNDGFDPDAFGSGWGEATASTELSTRTQENTENMERLSLTSFDSDLDNTKNDSTSHRPRTRRKSNSNDGFEGEGENKNDGTGLRPRPRRKSVDSFESFDSFGGEADNNANEGSSNQKSRRKSNSYEGERDGSHRSKPRRKSYGGRSRILRDAGGEGESLQAETEKKERRLKKEVVRNDDDRRRRSLSRSRRKPRRGSTTKLSDDKGSSGGDSEKKMPKGSSIRNMFNRKQGNEES
mmetsp:Transcript_20278/g.47675  ORF Transcript_20278/g.47675 Transcript_20278/m.47675 type:complete len:740 (+) Transcript_20278:316-2535(+)